MRFASHEVRWFFEDELDESGDVYTWFARKDWLGKTPPGVELKWPGFESREDVYRVLAESGDLGLKWRSEENIKGEKKTSLDIKGRTAELGSIQFGPNAVGRVERWVKWQYKNAAVPAAIGDAFNIDKHKQDLVSIRKNRILRRVRLDAFGNDEEVTTDVFIDRGLNIELTKLFVDESDAYWTLGFEAFPHDDDLHGAFQRNVCLFLKTYSGPNLDLERSKSYAEWLMDRATKRR
jgi:hypothetical protein